MGLASLFRYSLFHVCGAGWYIYEEPWSHSLNNDVLMLARAGAYSAILCIFPIVLVTAAILAVSPAAEVVRAELRAMLYQMFPPDIPPLVLAYFQGQHRSLRLLLSAATVFLLAANSVMTTLMEAMRRAYKIPEGAWSVPRQILIAFVLTFLIIFSVGAGLHVRRVRASD